MKRYHRPVPHKPWSRGFYRLELVRFLRRLGRNTEALGLLILAAGDARPPLP